MPTDPPKPKHDHQELHFPDGFLWGAGTSAHQVEGNNFYNDWWRFELKRDPEFRSGLAADQYHLYDKDFELAKDLGHTAHRFSIEWSRIEPEEGQFNQEEIAHYKQVLRSLKEKDIQVMLTLWHWTLPLWVADQGGWTNGKTIQYFARFVEKVVPEFADYVNLWITINEPGIYAWAAYYATIHPPQQRSLIKQFLAFWNLAQAHKKAYQIIHRQVIDAKVGMAAECFTFDIFHDHSIMEHLTMWGADLINNHIFMKITGRKYHDFLGLNYYRNSYISFDEHHQAFPKVVDIAETRKDVSDMGWEIHPDGIFSVIMDMSDYRLPIYITENGLASTNDDRRCRFLISYLKEVYHAIQAGADVRGYFYWSLIDNFEWSYGYNPRFGLIEVNYQTQARTPRPSAYVYAEIIKQNGIPHYLMKFIGHTVNAEEVLKKTAK